jgi:hypothetical protein
MNLILVDHPTIKLEASFHHIIYKSIYHMDKSRYVNRKTEESSTVPQQQQVVDAVLKIWI